MSLEQHLKAAAEPWLDREKMDPARAAALENLVRRRARRAGTRWFGLGVSAAAVAAAAIFWPVLVSVASGTPVVGPYIARMAKYDQGAYWAEQKGYVVPVGKSDSDNGYTFRVESIVADSARTVVYYTIEGPNLEGSRFPRMHVDFNLSRSRGGSGGRHEVVDGRMVGELHLLPLPTPVSAVRISVREIAGVAGNWTVSFMASRTELDHLARRVPVSHRWQGDGYDLQVTNLLIAPTQTIIEMEGTLAPDLEVRGAELVADGRTVQWHGAQTSGSRPPGHGISPPGQGDRAVQYRWAFDRVDSGDAAALLFRLTDVVRWQDGGPVLPLEPGARAEDGDLWFAFESVTPREGGTVVSVRIPWGDTTWRKNVDYADWVVIDADGTAHPAPSFGAWPAGDGTARMEIQVRAKLEDPVRLEARKRAVPVPDSFELHIPLQ